MQPTTIITATVFALTAAACVDAPDTSVDESELLGAPVDEVNTWAVGVCAGSLNADGSCKSARCTGSLIAPDLVLTARHCVHEIDYSNATGFCDGVFTTTPLTSSSVRITTNDSVLDANPVWHDVSEVLLSPVTDASCAGDIAILRLATPVPPTEARPVRVDLRHLTDHIPDTISIVGRGAIATVFDTTTYAVVSNDNGGLLRRKLSDIPVVCVTDEAPLCVADDIGAPFTVDPAYVQVGQSESLGDSGAGYIRQAPSSKFSGSLIAVSSAVTADPTTGIPNFAFGVRLDLHADFIEDTLCGH